MNVLVTYTICINIILFFINIILCIISIWFIKYINTKI